LPDNSSQPKRQGLAIASMVIGIVSCLALGFLGIGSITSIVLGAIALTKAKKEPDQFGGRGFAIVGIITGILSGIVSLLLFSILAYKFLFNPSTR
jgi:uncharacterized protein DUF4190